VSDPYVGEIRMFGGNFAPAGWAFCDGSLMPISENETLFNLIGTTYGGDGQTTFALPDLRGRVPVHMGSQSGQTYTIGEEAGVETVTLTVNQLPIHTHAAVGTTDVATTTQPQGEVPASVSAAGTVNAYGVLTPLTSLDPSTLAAAGGSQPHENMQPWLCVSFIISLFGIFPSPT
jgi:microcystin-dependent protein